MSDFNKIFGWNLVTCYLLKLFELLINTEHNIFAWYFEKVLLKLFHSFPTPLMGDEQNKKMCCFSTLLMGDKQNKKCWCFPNWFVNRIHPLHRCTWNKKEPISKFHPCLEQSISGEMLQVAFTPNLLRIVTVYFKSFGKTNSKRYELHWMPVITQKMVQNIPT